MHGEKFYQLHTETKPADQDLHSFSFTWWKYINKENAQLKKNSVFTYKIIYTCMLEYGMSRLMDMKIIRILCSRYVLI